VRSLAPAELRRRVGVFFANVCASNALNLPSSPTGKENEPLLRTTSPTARNEPDLDRVETGVLLLLMTGMSIRLKHAGERRKVR
jgi:hypothetical protein